VEQQSWTVSVEEVIARRVSTVLVAVVYSVRIEMPLDIEVDVVLANVVAVANAIVHIGNENSVMVVG